MIRRAWRGLALALIVVVAGLAAGPAAAEVGEVRIATQFGIAYLPIAVAADQRLIEAAATAAGLGPLKVTVVKFSGAPAVTDAMLTRAVDFAAMSSSGTLIAWDKTRGNLGMKGLLALTDMPVVMTTTRPGIRSLADIGPDDRIAMPATTSEQAFVLHYAADQAFGRGEQGRLDSRIVSLSHPDGMQALLGGRDVTVHFTSPPFSDFELADPRVHRVLTSADVFGHANMFIAVVGSEKFFQTGPKVAQAVLDGLEAAMRLIRDEPRRAAEIYLAAEPSKLMTVDFVERLLRDPANRFDPAPHGIVAAAEFLHRTGVIRAMPAGWQDVFLPPIHSRAGN